LTAATTPKPNVHILGGGVGAITAAFYLSAPGWQDRFETITVHQLGWRLGGKGASGRDPKPGHRNEEHGLHVWFGFYENAFRMMDRCHEELDAIHRTRGADDTRARWPSHHRSVEASFHPLDSVGLMENAARSWRPWVATFPRRPGLPWDRDLVNDPATFPPGQMLPDFLTQLVELGRSVVGSLEGGFFAERARRLEVQNAIDTVDRLLGVIATALRAPEVRAAISSAGANSAATRRWLDVAGPFLGETLATVDRTIDVIGRRLGRLFWWSEEVRRLWAILDLVLAVARGLLADRVVDDDTLQGLDEYEFREWLMKHGATEDSVNGPFVRAVVYDLAFAYESGATTHPLCGAATGLRGLHRLLFSYRGALMWKMNGGMGDVIFMPLYELLTKRGVTFEFFRQITNLGVTGHRVTCIEYRQQSSPPRCAQENLVLVDAGEPMGRGLCWRSVPEGQTAEDARKLESTWWRGQGEPRHQIDVAADDVVVLGISLGAIPYVAKDIIATSPRWQAMVQCVKTVPTEALQLWLDRPTSELGWQADATVGGYGQPFDTWSDMPASLIAESHDQTGPQGLAYFCSAFNTRDMAGQPLDPERREDAEGAENRSEAEERLQEDADLADHFDKAWKAADEELRRHVDAFVRRRLPLLWPGTSSRRNPVASPPVPGEPATELERPRLNVEVDRYERVNIDPTERYVLSVPGSSQHRLRPDASGFDNLFLAGDWTECTLNAGCVEAAVISGMTAARAIGTTEIIEIIGERARR
jgi:uncharacterized protein with NAD-binding domain and iron-sulfur cluster